MIETKNLKIGYQRVLVELGDIQLSDGQVYALVGKNGVGKSTFLHTLAGQIAPLSGDFLINNRSITSITMRDLPYEIAFSGTRFTELDFITVFEYVALGRSPYTNAFGVLQQVDLDVIHQALEQAKIQHLSNRNVADLSDGEKQLVNYARVLTQSTPNLLLDEPTAFLDYQNKLFLLDSLVQVARDEKKCIVLSSHDIDLLLEFKLPLLIVETQLKKVTLEGDGITKSELIQRAFN